MMGAQNARMLVKNQCRTKTTMSVFFVRVHVCEKMAITALYAPVSVERLCVKLGYAEVDRYVQCSGRSAQDQRANSSRILGRVKEEMSLTTHWLSKRENAQVVAKSRRRRADNN